MPLPRALLLALVSLGCAGGGDEADAADDRPTEGVSGGGLEADRTTVKVEPLTVGPVRDEIVVSGKVDARTNVQVFSKLSGREVVAIHREAGDEVSAGDPLMSLYDTDLVLDERTALASLDEARRTVEQIELQLEENRQRVVRSRRTEEKTDADLQRLLELDAEGLVVKQDLEDKRLAAEQADDDLELAKLTVRRTEIDLELAQIAQRKAEIAWERASKDVEYAQVLSPVDGVVAQRTAQVGQIMGTGGGEPPFVVVDTGDLVLNLRIPQDSLPKLAEGQPVEVRAVAARDAGPFTGRVRTVNPVLDRATGTVHVIVDLEPAPGLLPGLFVEARIVTAARDEALLVSKKAVLYEDDQPHFFAVNGEDAAIKVPFVAGASTPTEVEVVASLDGEPVDPALKIVVVGQEGLKDGDPVTVVESAF